MARAQGCCSQVPLHLALILGQFISAASSLITQAMLEDGVNKLVFGTYCLLLAALVLGIASFILERKRNVRFSIYILLQLIFLGFMCFVIQILLLVGLQNTSASFVSAIHPISPVFTATCAIIFGVETVKWYRHDGQVKVAGILICTIGAALMALYQGPCVIGHSCSAPHHDLAVIPPMPVAGAEAGLVLGLTRFQFGALCTILGYFCTGALGVFVATLLMKCPAPATILASALGIGAVVTGIAGMFTIDDSSAWLLSEKAILVVVFNGGISTSVFPLMLMWSLMKLGPTIVSCYTPANPIITSILSVIFLGTSIYLGSIIGAVLILIGLLLVSWAQEEYLRLSGLVKSDHCGGDLEEALIQPQQDQQ